MLSKLSTIIQIVKDHKVVTHAFKFVVHFI
jgi:hypothetical protein